MAEKRIIVPILGQDFSFPSVHLNDRNNFGQNIIPFEGELRQRGGHVAYGTLPMSTPVLHLAFYQKSNLTFLMIRISATKTQVYNSVTNVWNDITKSGVDWTGTEGINFFDHAVLADTLLLTNGIDNIQAYSGSGLCADLGGSPPKAKYMESYGDYVVLAHVEDGGTTYPTRVQWNDTGDPTDWSSGNSGSQDLADDPSPLVGIKKLNEFIVVYKEDSIYIGRLVDSIAVFQFTLQVTGIGLLNNRCVINHNGLHYFLAKNGNIYAFNGVIAEPIGDEIRTNIFPRLNSDRLETCHARKNKEDKVVEFYITVGFDSWPKESWSINYENGTIFKNKIDSVSTTTDFKDTEGQEIWDDDDDTWDSDTTRWDEGLGGIGFKFLLIGKADGIVAKELPSTLNDISTAICQQFITKDFHLDFHDKYKRWLMVEFWAQGDSLTLDYSIDFGTTWVSIPKDASTTKFVLTSEMAHYCGYCDVKNSHIRFRFQNDNVSESFRFREMALTANIEEALCT